MRRHRQLRRSAAVLVAALVCLLIALSIATTMIVESIARRGQLKIELHARQAELLVQAGRGRAVVRLAASADYDGESWAPELGDGLNATVDISVEPDDDGAIRVTVATQYPTDSPQAVRRSRVFLLTNANPSAEE